MSLSSFLKIHFNIISHLHVGLSLGRCSVCVCPHPICATCRAHPILRRFIMRKVFGEEHKSCNSSLCSFLPSPVTSSSYAQISSAAPFPQTAATSNHPSVSVTKLYAQKTTKICVVIDILVLTFLDSKLGHKRF
jgi:hypothetical protein